MAKTGILETWAGRPPLYVLHSGVPEDAALATQIASRTAPFSESECFVLEDFVAQRSRFGIYLGIAIVVISPPLLADERRLRTLERVLRTQISSDYFQNYCVAWRVSVAEVMADPVLASVAETVMFTDGATGVDELVAEVSAFLREDFANSPLAHDTSYAIRVGLKVLLGGVCTLVLAFLDQLYRLSVLAPLAFGLGWWLHWSYQLQFIIASMSAYLAAYRFNFLQPLDLWPWFGQRWKFAVRARSQFRARAWLLMPGGFIFYAGALATAAVAFWRENLVLYVAAGAVIAQILVDILALFSGARIDSPAPLAPLGAPQGSGAFSRSEFVVALTNATVVANRALLGAIASAAWRFAPAGVVLWFWRDDGPDSYWLAAALLFGFLTPTILSPATRMAALTGARYALTSLHEARTQAFLRPSPFARLSGAHGGVEMFAPEEQALVATWLGHLRTSMGGRFPLRQWRQRRMKAFVSYAWSDDAQTPTAAKVAAACEAGGVECFLDRTGFRFKQGAWRLPAAQAISDCTHVFVITSPGVPGARTMLREVDYVLSRWAFELEPAIICVADDVTAARLQQDPAAPLSMRFLLRYAPRLTPEEAFDPDIVRYVMALTRRRGKANDWFAWASQTAVVASQLRVDGVVEDFAPERADATEH